MSSTKKNLLCAALGIALVSTAYAAPEERKKPETMFRNAPSVSESETPSIADRKGGSLSTSKYGSLSESKPVSIERLPDGRISVKGKMHGGRGVDMEFVIPKIQPEVRITGPAGKDENGNDITWREKADRAIAHRAAFEMLKAQGYDYEKLKKEKKGVKTQLDYWNEMTEETRRHIKEHGPITTKDFILPGSTPELSAQLNHSDVGVRKENGKLVYYLNGKRLELYPERQRIEAPKPQAASTVTTKVSKGKRAYAPGVKPERIKAKTAEELLSRMEKPAVDALPKAPPTKAFEPDPEEDLRRRPTSTIVDPKTLPSADEVSDRIEEMFPDLKRPDSVSENGGRSGKVLQRLQRQPAGHEHGMQQGAQHGAERLVSFLFGIREAVAAEAKAGRGDEEPSEASSEETGAAAVRKGGERFADLIDEIEIETNGSLEKGGFAGLINEIRTNHDAVVKSVTDSKEGEAAEEGEEAGAALDAMPSYIDSVEIGGETYDPARFAADVVNRTAKSLTPEQFDADVEAIVSSLSEKRLEGGADVLQALAEILDANPEIFEVIPDAERALQDLRGELYEIAPANPLGEQTFIFVSYSLSEEVLRDIIERNGHRSDVTLVMRGVPEGMRIDNGMLRMQELANSVTPAAALMLDPPLFDAYGITRVPAVVRAGRTPPKSLMDPSRPNGRRYAPLVAKVTGLHNDEWLLDRIEAGERGDLGVQGDTKEIAEPNLIEEMKKRVLAIDWEAKKAEAVKRFWSKQTFDVLPTAETERVRELDPTIVVKEDIRDLAGRAVRKAGDRINPLQIRPFTQTMLVFNPLSKEETERITAFIEDFRKAGKLNLVLIATQVDKVKGWDGYEKLTDRLDQHVFLLTPEITERWQIEKTPTVVTADNARHVFLVRELGPMESEKETQK